MGQRAALIVGGASGIGAAVATAYRDRGVPVVVWDVDPSADVVCDIGDRDQIDEALRRTRDDHGLPDRVTITAGRGSAAPLWDLDPAEWDHILAVNTRGPLLVMAAVARAMAEEGVPGSLVATSSISARLADPSMGAYCASKAALEAVVRVAALEWGEHGIRVNAVAPGATRTPMLGGAPTDRGWLARVARRTPLGRIGEAADVAEAITGLHEMGWVTGAVLDCDGGLGRHSPILGGP